jgi:hypothetical protein
LNFVIDGNFQDLNLSPLILNEKVIPGDGAKELKDIDANYDIEVRC